MGGVGACRGLYEGMRRCRAWPVSLRLLCILSTFQFRLLLQPTNHTSALL